MIGNLNSKCSFFNTLLSWRTRIPSFKIHLHLFYTLPSLKTQSYIYWQRIDPSHQFYTLIISPLNGSPKQSLWQSNIPYVLNILITVRCFNGLLILFSVFFPCGEKKINELLCKKTVCLHLFPTKNSFNLQRQKIPPILSNDMHFFPHYKS